VKSLKISFGILGFCGTRYEQHRYRLNKKTNNRSDVSRFDGSIILKPDTRRTYWPIGRIISQIGKCPRIVFFLHFFIPLSFLIKTFMFILHANEVHMISAFIHFLSLKLHKHARCFSVVVISYWVCCVWCCVMSCRVGVVWPSRSATQLHARIETCYLKRMY
jgi:hypothetical protein